MTRKTYPHIRRHMTNGFEIIQDSIVLNYFIQHPHRDISASVLKTLDIYLEAVGAEKLRWYTDDDGELRPLDAKSWSDTRAQLSSEEGTSIGLWESRVSVGDHRIEYRGRALGTESYKWEPRATCGLTFWMPTKYLEEQGPAWVKTLAVAMARELPFNTGYATLAFNTEMDLASVPEVIEELCVQYPGLDIYEGGTTVNLGTQPRGAYWLNFYGQPVLDELGGARGLRERLTLPGISVQELGPHKVLVELGEWPEAEGEMPAYRQLARVLEPVLYRESLHIRGPEFLQRWERRFLD